MPDTDGKLTPAELQRVLQWFTLKTPAPHACSVCGTKNWGTGQYLVQPVTIGGSNTIAPGIAYPQIMIMCNNCGHTQLFNAVHLGIAPPVKPGA